MSAHLPGRPEADAAEASIVRRSPLVILNLARAVSGRRLVLVLNLARPARSWRTQSGRSFAALPRPAAKGLIGAIGGPEGTVAAGTGRDLALAGAGGDRDIVRSFSRR